MGRIGDGLRLPVIGRFADGSFLSVIVSPEATSARRDQVLTAVRTGKLVDPHEARFVRVIEYDVPDRPGNGHGELVCLITTTTDPGDTSAAVLAEIYHRRRDAETAFDQVKEHLRPPGKILRSRSPQLVKAEIWACC